MTADHRHDRLKSALRANLRKRKAAQDANGDDMARDKNNTEPQQTEKRKS